MDHSKHTPLTRQDLNQAVLADAPVYGADDRKIGTISHVHGAGAATDVVVDVGGFLGIGEKDVAIPFRTVEWMTTDRNARSASTGAMGTNNPPAATNNGAMGTNSTAANNATANRPANNTDVTGTTVSGSMDNRAYPDHGVLRMTKQDLQNAPSFHYADSSAARDNRAPQNPVPAGTKP